MSESFAEGLGDSLAGPQFLVASRQERAAAFDRLGIPAAGILSRATILKLAEAMDADYVIIGQYTFAGPNQLQASAQVLDMRPLKLSGRFTETGALSDLLEIQDRLANSISRALVLTRPESSLPGGPPAPVQKKVRLDAWENYIRGLLASNTATQIKYFLEASRLDPGLEQAALQLGKIYFQNRDYATAAPWLAKIKEGESNYLEANFLLGLSCFFLEDYDQAEAAFRTVAERVPLSEVYNNLAAAQSRRNRRTAGDNFHKAAEGDPSDADYQFNLGYWNWKNGQYAAAVRRLRLALGRRPNDAEARALLVKTLEAAGNSAEAAREREALARAPAAARLAKLEETNFARLERVKRNYDEPSFRQLQLTLETVTEESLSRLPPAKHAEAHLERGRELFREQSDAEALIELREAAELDGPRAETHLLLARLHERGGRPEEAIREARLALERQKSADAHLLLAKIYLEQNKLAEARQEAEQALEVEPESLAARSVLKTIQMRTP